MIKLLHTADLHLKAPDSEDSDYSIECLDILITKANEEEVDVVLLCGDIFDKPSDYTNKIFLSKVKSEFNKAKMPLLYIPGNHEDNSDNFSRLNSCNWGSQINLSTKPAIVTDYDIDLEILTIPHMNSYEKFTEWDLPEKNSKHRIAIAHGEIPGMTFLGDENGAGVLNSSIFTFHQVSHVFLGHIHKSQEIKSQGINYYYAGSPRPVRRKETGVRGFNIIEINDDIIVTRNDLIETGEVHRLIVNVLDNKWKAQIESSIKSIDSNSRISLVLKGMIADKKNLEKDIENLKKQLVGTFRRVDSNIEDVELLENFLENPFYKDIYERWQNAKPDIQEGYEYEKWLKMIEMVKFMQEEVLP